MERESRMLTEREAGRYLSLSKGKLRELIDVYVVRGIEIGSRLFYDRRDLDEAVTWMHKNWHNKLEDSNEK